MDRRPEPSDGAERKLLLGWLAFERDALAATCAELSDDELTLSSVLASTLSLQGLVRRLTEIEHLHLVHALGGDPGPFSRIYGSDDEPEADIRLLHPGDAQASLNRWQDERERADALLAKAKATDKCPGNGRSLRWNLMKVIAEYARHNGQAELIRQRIDGTTGR